MTYDRVITLPLRSLGAYMCSAAFSRGDRGVSFRAYCIQYININVILWSKVVASCSGIHTMLRYIKILYVYSSGHGREDRTWK